MTDTDTVALHTTDAGDGPPLVVLHGLYGAGNNWGRHARRWKADWRVLTPDLRNHGRSPHHPVMTYPAMADDVLRLLDERGIEQATVLGHSMGGKTAMTLALTHPERVRALVVADIAPVSYRGREHGDIVAAMQAVDLGAIGSRKDAEPTLAEAVATPAVRQFLLTNLGSRDGRWRWRLPLRTLSAALPEIQAFPRLPGRYTGPALFVYGERSDYVDAAARDVIPEQFPDARIEAIADAGHFLHVEQAEAFADTVSRFIDATLST
jgi:pimeloyl-ACP methyl ester carboxylesterase